MNRIKNILKNMRLERLALLFVMLFVINVFSMKVSEMTKNIAFKKRMMQKNMERKIRASESDEEKRKHEREKQYVKGKYLIYEQGTSNGFLVDAEEAKGWSNYIKDMVEDIGQEPKEIMFSFPVSIMKLGFDILNEKENNSLFEQLVNVADFFNFLRVSNAGWNNVLEQIKKNIEAQSDIKVINEYFRHLKELNSDMQKLLMAIPAINCLKTFIIRRIAKYVSLYKERTVSSVAFGPDSERFAVGFCTSGFFQKHEEGQNIGFWDDDNTNQVYDLPCILSVAFSLDEKYIIAVGECSSINNHNVYVFDAATKNIVTSFNAHPGTIRSVACLSSTNIVLGCNGNQDNFKIVDMLTGNILFNDSMPNAVNAVVCSADGKFIIVGCDGNENNLFLFDRNKAQFTNLISYNSSGDETFNSVTSLALSHDGSSLVSGSRDGSLILWGITYLDERKDYGFSRKLLARHAASVNSVAFSHDNKNILVGLSGSEANVELWDISDRDSIAHNAFTGIQNDIYTVLFGPEDKTFSVGGKYYNPFFSTLIEWNNLTDQQAALVNSLKEYNVDRLRLIYKLCLISLKGQTKKLNLDNEEQVIFKNLEDGMQKLLRDLRLIKK